MCMHIQTTSKNPRFAQKGDSSFRSAFDVFGCFPRWEKAAMARRSRCQGMWSKSCPSKATRLSTDTLRQVGRPDSVPCRACRTRVQDCGWRGLQRWRGWAPYEPVH
eukprot:366260-Chlamydomonas_euryale.AAC.36